MKTEYLFKPNLHWNYIPEDVYQELKKFYSDEVLKIEEEEEWQ